MTMRIGDLHKTVTLAQVEEALREYKNLFPVTHTVDLGDAGYLEVDCDESVELDLHGILSKLERVSKEGL